MIYRRRLHWSVRDVEMQRLQFALKASLRGASLADAAKLCLKAGGVIAGDRRQRELIRTNTDFASHFMDADRVQEMVSRRTFESSWTGSRHAYEAGFLSAKSDFAGNARSRLRMTYQSGLRELESSHTTRKNRFPNALATKTSRKSQWPN